MRLAFCLFAGYLFWYLLGTLLYLIGREMGTFPLPFKWWYPFDNIFQQLQARNYWSVLIFTVGLPITVAYLVSFAL